MPSVSVAVLVLEPKVNTVNTWRTTQNLTKVSTTVLFEALCTSSVFHLSCLWNNIFGQILIQSPYMFSIIFQCFLYSCSWRLIHRYLVSLSRIICSMEQIVLQDWLYCNTIKLFFLRVTEFILYQSAKNFCFRERIVVKWTWHLFSLMCSCLWLIHQH